MSTSRFPFTSFPTGWFLVGLSKEILPGKLISKKIFDQEIVIFRTVSGVLSVLDAYCTHLGAHLGYGGRIEGESIRCPFHGFCFNTEGDCVATHNGTPPPKKMPIKKWTLCETRGLIFVWHDETGAGPSWEIPHIKTEGWSPYHSYSSTLRAHPQEIGENGIDTMHFTALHGLKNVEIIEKASTRDHFFHARYAYFRPGLLRWLSNKLMRVEFDINMYGLGYVFVNITIPQYDLHMHYMVFVTPIDNEIVNFTSVLSITQMNFQTVYPLLRCIPNKLINAIATKLIFYQGIEILKEDFEIWENKKYVSTPFLVSSDGPVGKYRQWAKQFYKNHEQIVAD